MNIEKSCLDCIYGFADSGSDVVGKSCDYLKKIEIKLPGYASKHTLDHSLVMEFTNTSGRKLSAYISPKHPYVDCEAYVKNVKE